MKTIYKYITPVADQFEIDFPIGGKILTVQEQGSNGCIWVEQDSEAPTWKRKFVLVGTGHPLRTPPNSELEYIGTYQLLGGALVYHLYVVNDIK